MCVKFEKKIRLKKNRNLKNKNQNLFDFFIIKMLKNFYFYFSNFYVFSKIKIFQIWHRHFWNTHLTFPERIEKISLKTEKLSCDF